MGDEYLDDELIRRRSMYALEEIAQHLGNIGDELSRIGVSQGPCDSQMNYKTEGGYSTSICNLRALHTGLHTNNRNRWTDEEAESSKILSY